MKRRRRWVCLVIQAAVVGGLALVILDGLLGTKVEVLKAGEKGCTKGSECARRSIYCCNQTISKFFDSERFNALFPQRNAPVAHAPGFWDYHSFIAASAEYQPSGFATTGGQPLQAKELAAFFAIVAAQTTCGYDKAPGGPFAWGLCYNTELSPSHPYCDGSCTTYPCRSGVSYHCRGALLVCWNCNYGEIGAALKLDLLNHPERLEQNATQAFQAAIWRWMTPVNEEQPSAHAAFAGKWKPTKNDTQSKRVPGFGTAMNVLFGDRVCGGRDVELMNNCISHYKNFLELLGVGEDQAGPDAQLSCAEQIAFNPSAS